MPFSASYSSTQGTVSSIFPVWSSFPKGKVSFLLSSWQDIMLFYNLGQGKYLFYKVPTLPQTEEHRGAIFLTEYVSKRWLPGFWRNSVLGCKTGKTLEEDLYSFQRGRERLYNDSFKVNVRQGTSGTGVRKKPAWCLANLWGVLRSSWSGHRHSSHCGHLNSSVAPRGPESSHSCGLNYCFQPRCSGFAVLWRVSHQCHFYSIIKWLFFATFLAVSSTLSTQWRWLSCSYTTGCPCLWTFTPMSAVGKAPA